MKHLTTTLLAFSLLFSVNTLMAQEKYDYATIAYTTATGLKVFTCINGVEAKEIQIGKKEVINYYWDTSPALKELNRMEDEGWELFNTQVTGINYVFFLRRKEQ